MTSIEAVTKASEGVSGMYWGLRLAPAVIVRPDRLHEIEGTIYEAYLNPELASTRPKSLTLEQIEQLKSLFMPE